MLSISFNSSQKSQWRKNVRKDKIHETKTLFVEMKIHEAKTLFLEYKTCLLTNVGSAGLLCCRVSNAITRNQMQIFEMKAQYLSPCSALR